MHILLAPNAFKHSLNAQEVANAIPYIGEQRKTEQRATKNANFFPQKNHKWIYCFAKTHPMLFK